MPPPEQQRQSFVSRLLHRPPPQNVAALIELDAAIGAQVVHEHPELRTGSTALNRLVRREVEHAHKSIRERVSRDHISEQDSIEREAAARHITLQHGQHHEQPGHHHEQPAPHPVEHQTQPTQPQPEQPAPQHPVQDAPLHTEHELEYMRKWAAEGPSLANVSMVFNREWDARQNQVLQTLSGDQLDAAQRALNSLAERRTAITRQFDEGRLTGAQAAAALVLLCVIPEIQWK